MNLSSHLTHRTAVWLALAALGGPVGSPRGFAQDADNATAAQEQKVARDIRLLAELRVAQTPEPPEAPEPAEPPEPPEPPEAGVEWQGQLQRAQTEVGRAMRDAQHHIAAMRFSYNGADAPRLLVIPGVQTSDEVIAQNREDLAVMSRILARAVNPAKPRHDNLIFQIDGFGFGGRRDLEAMQIEGFGAVFLLDVNYPLVPAPAEAGTPAKVKGPKDDTWEKARRELAGDNSADEESDDPFDGHGRRPGPPYEGERVAGLKRTLIEALPHAHNLRGLKPDDWVIVKVSGPAPGRPAPAVEKGADNKRNVSRGQGAASSVLTLRVHKADVDNFALDRVQLDEFTRQVQVAERIEGAITPAKKGE